MLASPVMLSSAVVAAWCALAGAGPELSRGTDRGVEGPEAVVASEPGRAVEGPEAIVVPAPVGAEPDREVEGPVVAEPGREVEGPVVGPDAKVVGAPARAAREAADEVDDVDEVDRGTNDRWMTQETGERNELPREHVAAIGRLHNYLGLVAGASLSGRRVGAAGGEPEASLRGGVGVGGLMARLAGYAERHPVGAKVVRMTLPELMLTLELGGSAVGRDAGARERGLAPGQGLAAGGRGVANIGAAFASAGRVGVYAKVWVGQRFLARANDELEGAYFIGSAGPGAGLRVASGRVLTLLLGGGLDGALGVQRLNQSRLIAQLAPAVDLAAYLQPRSRLYFGVVARGEITAIGQRYGGQRLHGRATAELAWKLRAGLRAPFAALLLVYEGGQIVAGPGHPQFGAAGERRSGHHLLFAGGLTF